MNMIRTFILAAAVAALPTGIFAQEIKIALDSPPDLERSGSYVWAHNFAEALKAAGMEAREIPRDAIGGEAEKLDQLSIGLLEVSLSDVNSVGRIDPFIMGVRLPYIFDDVAHMDRVLAEGDILDFVNERIVEAGVRVLALAPLGPPSGIINTRKPIEQPEDLRGLRMRALDDAQIALYEAWGSQGTIVSWAEVPAAMQTGVVDGYLNTALVPVMFGQTDIVKYFTDAGVINALRAVIVSDDWYQGLGEDERVAVEGAVAKANQANREWLAEIGPKSLSDLEAAGVEITILDEAARERFRDLSSKVYDDGLLAPDQIQRWIELAEQTR
jgi:TRAP-type C4-dicarboxylate transport system substrate-binding protein